MDDEDTCLVNIIGLNFFAQRLLRRLDIQEPRNSRKKLLASGDGAWWLVLRFQVHRTHGLTMTSVAYYYDTLCPLGSFSPDPTPAPDSGLRPTTLSGEPESYEVFRNEISSSTLDSFAPQSATVDYFSLDVSADAALEPTTPNPPPRSVSKADDEKKLELALESGWFRSNCKFKSPMLQLHKGEILDFCEFLSPTPEEEALRHAAIDSVFEVIKYIWPSCRVEVFGSFRTGLYLPSSDIDVVILGSNIRTPQMGLQALSRALSQRGIAKKIQVIGKARVPIIKFVEKNSELSFDCSFDLDNGPKAADYIKDAIVKLPPLRPLCLIIKVFLQQRELNEVYSGGIGSYALLVMLIALLRNLNESQTCPEQNLGILLVKFFELYSKKLNTYDVGVSCNGKGTFFSKDSKGFLGKGFLISIQDPQTPDNDIGKSSFNYFQVKSAFKMAYSTLTNVKTIMSLGPKRSILGTIIRPDSVLIERKGGRNGDITFNGLLPGAGEPVPCDDRQDILCNWQMNEEDDDLTLPRDTEPRKNGDPSPKKRRKSSRKVMENGHACKEM
ncbi:hypothetical protein V2J09_008822 [Rumex salicifolius]